MYSLSRNTKSIFGLIRRPLPFRLFFLPTRFTPILVAPATGTGPSYAAAMKHKKLFSSPILSEAESFVLSPRAACTHAVLQLRKRQTEPHPQINQSAINSPVVVAALNCSQIDCAPALLHCASSCATAGEPDVGAARVVMSRRKINPCPFTQPQHNSKVLSLQDTGPLRPILNALKRRMVLFFLQHERTQRPHLEHTCLRRPKIYIIYIYICAVQQ